MHTKTTLVPVAVEKIEGLATVVTFLGVLIDTSRFELRLPEPKKNYIREMIGIWLAKRSGRCDKFESLLGHPSHAAIIIRQGRTFLCHLFNILSATHSRHHHVQLYCTGRPLMVGVFFPAMEQDYVFSSFP